MDQLVPHTRFPAARDRQVASSYSLSCWIVYVVIRRRCAGVFPGDPGGQSVRCDHLTVTMKSECRSIVIDNGLRRADHFRLLGHATGNRRPKEVMPASITNYDGGIVSTPQVVAKPATVGELQEILRDKNKYPGPVRAMGSYHSLTPCASSTGTIVDM